MDGMRAQKAAYLVLDQLVPNPTLARRLPPDVARQFHALPLAEDNGRITVAMGDPEDAAAREAVAAALGRVSCVVQADAKLIDTVLAAIWKDGEEAGPKLLVCDHPNPVTSEISEYAQAIGSLLGAQVEYSSARDTQAVTSEFDLAILSDSDQPLFHRLLARPSAAPTAMLAVREPRWPLRSILLVLCGDETDEAALDWVVRLARAAASSVTVLAMAPSLPATDGCRGRMDQGLPTLLTSETDLGRRMHMAAHQLVTWGIEATLRLRQGPPDWQIRREVIEGDYDLIALTAKPCQWWQRWLKGVPGESLLLWTDRPVLVARSPLSLSK